MASHASGAGDEIQSPKNPSPDIPYGVIDPKLLPIGYSGDERFEYDISWSGGIKIGELHLDITKLKDVEEGYKIKAHITTEGGLINHIYPVKDTHITHVRGRQRLPYKYEVWQKEGYNYEAHRLTEYDQKKGYIKLRKNSKNEGEYHVIGYVNNEFSSFFNSRLMSHEVGEKFIVPTFADKRRVEVVVNTVSKKNLEKTSLGSVSAVEVMPIMNFKGLYDKKGDTVIWYTDDKCRIPVLIKSKIVIGSLTAKLAAYENSACSIYSPVRRDEK
jgi:hypothetical protein